MSKKALYGYGTQDDIPLAFGELEAINAAQALADEWHEPVVIWTPALVILPAANGVKSAFGEVMRGYAKDIAAGIKGAKAPRAKKAKNAKKGKK